MSFLNIVKDFAEKMNRRDLILILLYFPIFTIIGVLFKTGVIPYPIQEMYSGGYSRLTTYSSSVSKVSETTLKQSISYEYKKYLPYGINWNYNHYNYDSSI